MRETFKLDLNNYSILEDREDRLVVVAELKPHERIKERALLFATAPNTATERDRLREAINTAYGRINALGGRADDQFGYGVNHAVDQALKILDELGAVDPLKGGKADG